MSVQSSSRPNPQTPLNANLDQRIRRNTRSRRVEMFFVYIFLIAFALFILIPFIWPFLSAFTTKPEDVSSLYLYWPKSFTLEHFN